MAVHKRGGVRIAGHSSITVSQRYVERLEALNGRMGEKAKAQPEIRHGATTVSTTVLAGLLVSR